MYSFNDRMVSDGYMSVMLLTDRCRKALSELNIKQVSSRAVNFSYSKFPICNLPKYLKFIIRGREKKVENNSPPHCPRQKKSSCFKICVNLD